MRYDQNAPRDPDKLERLLKSKRRQKEEAMYFEDTERLVTEIEMLLTVLYLVCRNMHMQIHVHSLDPSCRYIVKHSYHIWISIARLTNKIVTFFDGCIHLYILLIVKD
jgi:hypothetical protein